MNQTQQGAIPDGSDDKNGAVSSAAPLLVLKGLDKRFGGGLGELSFRRPAGPFLHVTQIAGQS